MAPAPAGVLACVHEKKGKESPASKEVSSTTVRKEGSLRIVQSVRKFHQGKSSQ